MSGAVYFDNKTLIGQGAKIVSYANEGDTLTYQGVVTRTNSPIRDLRVHAGIIYALTGSGLSAFLLGPDGLLVQSCSHEVEEYASDIEFYGNLLLMNIGGDGVYVFELGPNCGFNQTGKVAMDDNGFDIDVLGDTLAVARGDAGLSLYSLADPKNITLASTMGTVARRIEFREPAQLLVVGDDQISAVSVEDVRSPQIVSTIGVRSIGDGKTFLQNNELLVLPDTGRSQVVAFTDTGMKMSPGPSIGAGISSVAGVGPGVVVCGQFGVVYLVRDATQWRVADQKSTIANVFAARDSSTDALYLLDFGRGLSIVGSGPDENPSLFSALDIAGAGNLSVNGGLAAVSYSESRGQGTPGAYGVKLFRYSAASAEPQAIGTISNDTGIADVVVDSNRVYVCDSNACPKIYTVQADNSVLRGDSYDVSNITAIGLSISGNTAVVNALRDGVRVLDVQDPSHIAQLSEISTVGNALDSLIVGDNLYICDVSAGVLVYGNVRGGKPDLKYTLEVEKPVMISGMSDRVSVAGGTGAKVMTTFDAQDQDLVGARTTRLPCRARSLEVTTGLVLVSAERCGLFVYSDSPDQQWHKLFLPAAVQKRVSSQ